MSVVRDDLHGIRGKSLEMSFVFLAWYVEPSVCCIISRPSPSFPGGELNPHPAPDMNGDNGLLALGAKPPEWLTEMACCLVFRPRPGRQAQGIMPPTSEDLVWYGFGVAMQAKDKMEKAIVCYKKAILLNPDLYKAHYNLAMALLAEGDLTGQFSSPPSPPALFSKPRPPTSCHSSKLFHLTPVITYYYLVICIQ